MGISYKIGTITVPHKRTVTQTYECAAWYRQIVLEPGTFDVTLGFTWYGSPDFALFGQSGTVIGSCFDSLFCGNLIAKKRDQDIGEKADYTTALRAYLLNEQTIGTLNLAPEWLWILLDHKQWRPHTNRLRVLRSMEGHKFDIVKVDVEGQSEHFTVHVRHGGEIVPICLSIGNDSFILTRHDCSGDYPLCDIREDGLWRAIYDLKRRGEPVTT